MNLTAAEIRMRMQESAPAWERVWLAAEAMVEVLLRQHIRYLMIEIAAANAADEIRAMAAAPL